MTVNITDWVQGNSRRGELIHGYVEAVDAVKGVLDVYVVASDNEEAVGTSIKLQTDWVRALPETADPGEAGLRDLVDLALSLGDRGWFQELTGRLNRTGLPENDVPASPRGIYRPVNRLGEYGLK